MRLAVFGDNGIGGWFAQLFEPMDDVVFFLSDRNKSGLDVTRHEKFVLSNRAVTRSALLHPLRNLARLKENGYDRKLDFHYFEIEEAVRRRLFDVAITKSDRSLHTLAALKRRHGTFKLAYWVPFTIPFVDLFDARSFRIRQQAFPQVDKFIAITRTCRDTLAFEGIAEGRIEHVYPGIDLAAFQPGSRAEAAPRTGMRADRFNLLFVGKLASWKGCYTLLYAMKLVRQTIPAAHLTLVGSGAQKERMVAMSRLLGMEEHVTLRDAVPYREMPHYYNLADVFVLPALPAVNLAEQFGYVVAEAMASGVPAIVSRVGALPEVVGDEPALIFTPGDYRELADKIIALHRSPELRGRLSAHCLARATEHYSAAVNGRKLSAVLRTMV